MQGIQTKTQMQLTIEVAVGFDRDETLKSITFVVPFHTTTKALMEKVTADPRMLIFCSEWLGFQYQDKKGNVLWLQKHERVSSHDLDASGSLKLAPLYYPLDFGQSSLFCARTLMIFYGAIRSAISLGQICTDKPKSQLEDEIIVQLAALSLQVEYGDWNKKIMDEETDYLLQHRDVLPHRFYMSDLQCKNKLFELHKQYLHLERNAAIMLYLTLAQTLPMYGVSYFPVVRRWSKMNKSPHLLGFHARGISVYSVADKRNPIANLPWADIIQCHVRTSKKLKNYFIVRTVVEKKKFTTANRTISTLMEMLYKGYKKRILS